MSTNNTAVPFSQLTAAELLLRIAQTTTRSKAEREARGMTPTQRLMTALGNPEQRLPPCIHITGSKGKGSTALIVESIALVAGLRVGTFTSPHLQHFRERIRLNGEPMTPEAFEQAFDPIRDYCQQHPDALPTFPEALTAAGLSVFAKSDLDIVIIEVGLGGRLDPSNVITADVAVLTNIELEHQQALGDTLIEIADEKAGIFKPQKLALIGPVVQAVRPTLAKKAYQQQTNAYFMGQGIQLKQLANGWRLSLPWLKLDLPNSQQCSQMTLPHQRNNVALAVAAITALDIIPGEALLESLNKGLNNLSLPGKLDWQPATESKPAILIDSAHTASSMQALRDFIDRQFPEQPQRCRLIISVATSKDIETLIMPLLPIITDIYCTSVNDRSMPVDELQQALQETLDKSNAQNTITISTLPTTDALASAIQATDLDQNDLLLITGSTYLAGAAYHR